MSAVAISAEGLGKSYLIRHRRDAHEYTSLRELLEQRLRGLARAVVRGTPPQPTSQEEQFWALRDVTFEVRQGERLGIIGRNGAGKSTLLKILSRITEPSDGKVRIRGRVASLLEVGTGFHPELTGRENIFLNGAILGMSKSEIRRKFDEIVSFAEVERFLDTPVKRYSSGMYVRLAFAVAAHLEPEILVVDEVLAVGDAQFQSKCLGKMRQLGDAGRTLIFVSHNMNAVERLCTSAILLEAGELKYQSQNVEAVITSYLAGKDAESQGCIWTSAGSELKTSWFTPTRFGVTDEQGRPLSNPVRNDADAWVHIEGTIEVVDPALQVGYALYSTEGTLLYWTCHTDSAEEAWGRPTVGRNIFRSRFPCRLLNEGDYRLELLSALYCRQWLSEPGVTPAAVAISVRGGLSDSPYWMVKRPGTLAPEIRWSVEQRV
jgi:lipopolysaccharide transport system ATP-binding protein